MEPGAAVVAETRRLKHHFDGALAMLALRDDARLARARRDRRAKLTRELRRYQARGRFPKNDRFLARMPFFVDTDGTRCAMAHLIESSGHAPLVERVAASRNNAFVRELASDAELQDWLLGHGMTVAEAARIQPSYDPKFMAEEFCDRAPYKEVARVMGSADSVTVAEVYAKSGLLHVGQVLSRESIRGRVLAGQEVFLVPVPFQGGGLAWQPTRYRHTAEHVLFSDGMGTTSRIPIGVAGRALLSRSCVKDLLPYASVTTTKGDTPESPRASAPASPSASAPASTTTSASASASAPADRKEPSSGCACSSMESVPVEAGAAISMASLLLLCGWARRLHR